MQNQSDQSSVQLFVHCPGCDRTYRCDSTARGRKLQCRSCEAIFRIADRKDADSSARTARQSTPPRKAKSRQQPPRRKKPRPRPDASWEEEADWAGPISPSDWNDEYQPQLPPRRRKKKKTSAKATKAPTFADRVKSLGFIGWMACGLFAGTIGVGLTILLGMTGSGFLISVGALLTGSLVGGAVHEAAKPTNGWAPGLTAAVLALGMIFTGKVGAFYFFTDAMFDSLSDGEVSIQQEIAERTSDKGMISDIAEDIIVRKLDSGAMTFAEYAAFEESVDEDAEDFADWYPEDVWAEATAQWNAMPEEKRQKRRNRILNEYDEGDHLDPAADSADSEALWSVAFVFAIGNMFLPLSSLAFVVTGVTSAFKIASGLNSD